jgi:hypothetical protein
MMQFAQGPDFLIDAAELDIGIFLLAEVQDAHVHEIGTALGIHMDDPETKEIGSGIDAEYGA